MLQDVVYSPIGAMLGNTVLVAREEKAKMIPTIPSPQLGNRLPEGCKPRPANKHRCVRLTRVRNLSPRHVRHQVGGTSVMMSFSFSLVYCPVKFRTGLTQL